MFDEQLRGRLEALNRGPLPMVVGPRAGAAAVATDPAAANSYRPIRRIDPTSPTAGSAGARTMMPMPGLLRRGEVVVTGVGEHLRIRLPLDELWPGGTRLITARQLHLQQVLIAAEQAVEPTVVMDAEFVSVVQAMPDRILLLDLETCGLAGAALFLVGLLRTIDGLPTVEMLFARNYAEEAGILESLWQTVAGHDVLVTFNGKSFDWPMVIDRSVRHRLALGWAPPSSNAPLRPTLVGGAHTTHVDVLHHARRRWRKQLPDCRLQTLERLICRRRRIGDLPGPAIPAVYANYVRTGFEREIDAILHHNALDLVTLLDVTLRLAA